MFFLFVWFDINIMMMDINNAIHFLFFRDDFFPTITTMMLFGFFDGYVAGHIGMIGVNILFFFIFFLYTGNEKYQHFIQSYQSYQHCAILIFTILILTMLIFNVSTQSIIFSGGNVDIQLINIVRNCLICSFFAFQAI